MKLSELMGKPQIVKIDNKDYEIKYNTRALLELEEYPVGNPILMLQIFANPTGMTVRQIINFLYAGLIGGGNKEITRDYLIDNILPTEYSIYLPCIVDAYASSTLTKEQMDQLEVLAETAMDRTKKKFDETMK